MAMTLQAIFGPAILIFGLFHLLQPALGVRFFVELRKTGLATLIIPMYTLPCGLVLVVGHKEWVWDWPLFLTLGGWGMTIKSTVYLLVPQTAEWTMARVDRYPPMSWRVLGIAMALLGAVLTWQALNKGYYL